MGSIGVAKAVTLSRVNTDCGCCLRILEQEGGSVRVSEVMLFEQLVPNFGALPLRRVT